MFQKLLLLLAGSSIVLYELFNIRNKYRNYRQLKETSTSDIEDILSLKEGDPFECAGLLLETSRSPITNTACGWWNFFLMELKVSTRGNSGTVPILATAADFRWGLIQTKQHILAIPLNKDGVELERTYFWNSVLGEKFPEAIERYLRLPQHIMDSNYLLNLYPSLATSTQENIIPTSKSLHVNGLVRPLSADEIHEIKEKLRELKISLELIPSTLDGENYRVGLSGEEGIIKTLKSEVVLHSYVLAFAVVATLYMAINWIQSR